MELRPLQSTTHDQITLRMPEGWGRLWQGMQTDTFVRQLPGPLVIVNMQSGFVDCGWIDQVNVWATLEVQIKDFEDAVLPDLVYLALVESCVSFLRSGVNLYVHCAMGASRSSYLTLGILMRLFGLRAWEARGILRGRRELAAPNNGFVQHLDDLEGELLRRWEVDAFAPQLDHTWMLDREVP